MSSRMVDIADYDEAVELIDVADLEIGQFAEIVDGGGNNGAIITRVYPTGDPFVAVNTDKMGPNNAPFASTWAAGANFKVRILGPDEGILLHN